MKTNKKTKEAPDFLGFWRKINRIIVSGSGAGEVRAFHAGQPSADEALHNLDDAYSTRQQVLTDAEIARALTQ